ncbi:MAG: hypothetical protein AAFX79_12880 [Planctomycetota bacterium]
MIGAKSVFVLGAGASLEYGFPLGSQLRRAIIALALGQNTAPKDMPLALQGPAWNRLVDQRAKLLQPCFSHDLMEDFGKSFRYSGTASIDAYLIRRQRFRAIGSAIIGLIISACEKHEYLFDRLGLYWWLLDRMGSTPEVVRENPVTFITFNYDRSLEYFFVRAAYEQGSNPGAASSDSIAANSMLDAINIVHMYGSLGDLPRWGGAVNPVRHQPYEKWLDEQRCHYSVYDLDRWNTSLKLVGEERSAEATEHHERARQAILECDVLCFLGFGFDRENTRVLGFPMRGGGIMNHAMDYCGRQRAHMPHVLATSIGLSKSRKTEVLYRLLFTQAVRDRVQNSSPFRDVTCSALLDEQIQDFKAEYEPGSPPRFDDATQS